MKERERWQLTPLCHNTGPYSYGIECEFLNKWWLSLGHLKCVLFFNPKVPTLLFNFFMICPLKNDLWIFPLVSILPIADSCTVQQVPSGRSTSCKSLPVSRHGFRSGFPLSLLRKAEEAISNLVVFLLVTLDVTVPVNNCICLLTRHCKIVTWYPFSYFIRIL